MSWQRTCDIRWFKVTTEIALDNNHGQINIDSCGKTIQSMSVTTKVLRQKWVNQPNEALTEEEWRDVPTED